MNNHFVFYCWQGSSSPTILPNFCPVSVLAFKYVKYRSIKLSAAKNAIVEYDQGILSTAAVAAMPYFNHTVLFIGTRQGQLLKVHVYFFSLLIISPSPSSRFPLCLATTLFAEIKYVARSNLVSLYLNMHLRICFVVRINLYLNLLFLAKYKDARYPLLSNHREVMVIISLLTTHAGIQISICYWLRQGLMDTFF